MQSRTTGSDGEVLHVDGLTKRFGGTEALRGVDFVVRRGEIHALLGANGAGKSTLIKILAGVYPSDGGKIEVAGRPLDESSRKSIAFVHQDLGLIESMSVGENMAMGYGYPRRWKLIDWAAVDRAADAAVARLGSPLPPRSAGVGTEPRREIHRRHRPRAGERPRAPGARRADRQPAGG
jgi:ribose transport system ATP-binding protein